jgi:hypothetical protein
MSEDESIANHASHWQEVFKSEFVIGGNVKLPSFVENKDEEYSEGPPPEKNELKIERESFIQRPDDRERVIKELCGRIVEREGGYQSKIDAYRMKRGPLDQSIAPFQPLGADCDLQQILNSTSQTQVRVTSVNGPAAQRYLERQPRVIIRGLTRAEAEVVESNHREKQRWNQVL